MFDRRKRVCCDYLPRKLADLSALGNTIRARDGTCCVCSSHLPRPGQGSPFFPTNQPLTKPSNNTFPEIKLGRFLRISLLHLLSHLLTHSLTHGLFNSRFFFLLFTLDHTHAHSSHIPLLISTFFSPGRHCLCYRCTFHASAIGRPQQSCSLRTCFKS